ncbi:Retron-type reverse transcriptase [Bosea sp. OK403]|uniref:reverse transcriptase domain-containing protein n=1 Tax=Bosea sp. OK403 TaxID=1855286 RepID=UPI0008F2A73C|nr:reverse transcriptase domain-containing protein [Bosea sp. OK403]SFI65451.1 Retron-type reverse transcriptase [Bosea sp. OK403]
MAELFQEVRSERNIFSAWRHVKRSALTSGNQDIRGMASEFEHAHQKHLRRIITQLRENRFIFDPVDGVLKDKRKREAQGKDPRPIAIATLKNRVVQRAILQILQPREARDLRDVDSRFETKRDDRLGKINNVNRSEFGVGGLIYPYGGVRPAIEKIMGAIDTGAKYFYQSDIKAFFTKIPTRNVVDFVRRETRDDALADLFEQALAVHLANADELKGYADLFPKGGIGVAQGSSLSAFAGNVLLYEMDHELNNTGVTAVRYIDDILIVSENETDLESAITLAKSRLEGFGFGLYSPANGSDKAARGECDKAINFLGCTIQPRRCVPSKASIDKLISGVASSLSASKSAINDALKTGKRLDSRMSQSAVLHQLGDKIYGWQKSFAFCNEDQPFRHVDDQITNHVSGYQGFISRKLADIDTPRQMMILGIPATSTLFLTDKARNRSKSATAK